MGALVDRIRSLVVTADSPDGTVRARLAGLGSVEIRLSSTAMARNDETTLADQISQVLSTVVEDYQGCVDRLRHRSSRPTDTTTPHRPDVLAEPAAIGTSTAKYVRIGWRGRSDIEVRIKPRTFTRCDRDRLTDEINSALAAVSRSRTRQLQVAERLTEPAPVSAGRNLSHG